MKAEKLPSGNWRVRVYLGTVEGKQKYKSITARTRAEAFREAALYEPKVFEDLTVAEAAQEYIDVKAPVISPSTLAGYRKILRVYLDPEPIAAVKLDALTSVTVQRWVSDLARDLSPKSVRNAFGFLSAVLSLYAPELKVRVKLPQRKPQTLYTPTTSDVNAILDVADPELKKAVLLGATAMMRRGEICALTAADADFLRCRITVRGSVVKGADGQYVLKAPKTEGSFRVVDVNPEVMSLLPREGRLVDLTPDQITMRFNRALKKAGLPAFRFHDLRHYAASIAVSSAIGAGALTVQGRGGWNSDSVMKRVYTHSLSDQQKKDTDNIIRFFSENIHFGGSSV